MSDLQQSYEQHIADTNAAYERWLAAFAAAEVAGDYVIADMHYKVDLNAAYERWKAAVETWQREQQRPDADSTG